MQPATVDQIRPQVGMMSRAMMVIAKVMNPGPWRPEATIEARLVVESRPASAVVIPIASLVKRPAGDVVFVLAEAGEQRARQRIVTVGERLNGSIEIRSGLQAGESHRRGWRPLPYRRRPGRCAGEASCERARNAQSGQDPRVATGRG